MTSFGRRSLGWISPVVLACAWAGLQGQPRLKGTVPESYKVGDRIDSSTFVLDREMRPRPLMEIIGGNAEIVVLVIFGGAGKEAPAGETMRGGIWCADSFDEFPLQRALMNQFADAPVQFVGVAVPPVYSRRFGFERDVFLRRPDSDRRYRKAAQTFIEATERLRREDIVPFDALYYDPKYRLAQNKKEAELDPEAFGTVHPWQGLLKWSEDARRYGTPTIWILDSKGVVLQPPFFGNEYERQPPELAYGFRDVKKAIDDLLEKRAEAPE